MWLSNVLSSFQHSLHKDICYEKRTQAGIYICSIVLWLLVHSNAGYLCQWDVGMQIVCKQMKTVILSWLQIDGTRGFSRSIDQKTTSATYQPDTLVVFRAKVP